MNSVLGEISHLREKSGNIDLSNSNRYCLVLKENDGTKTAYYFSSPIYNQMTRKMVDMKFKYSGDNISYIGSNANIILSENILMKNTDGICSIQLHKKATATSSYQVSSGVDTIMPTLNGVAIKHPVNDDNCYILEVNQSFLNVRANDRCFALMKEQFRPFVVVSCVGSLDSSGNVIAPARIEYLKLTDRKYKITISATDPLAKYVLFECNLYENKLFQDTTVESFNSFTNNAFGSIAFIGNSLTYGEQWLYSRLDYSKISEMSDKRINKIIMHMPRFNKIPSVISAYKVKARFCSFGSTWNNKVPGDFLVSDSYINVSYQSIDITKLLVSGRTKAIMRSEGLILKPKIKGNEFSVVSTGDSYYAPQILEINYR